MSKKVKFRNQPDAFAEGIYNFSDEFNIYKEFKL